MSTHSEPAPSVHARVLAHLLARIRLADMWDEPFTHITLVDVFPADVYAALLANLPLAERYQSGPNSPHSHPGARTLFNLTIRGVQSFPTVSRNLWRGVTAALTDTELKRGLYAKLAPDLRHRFGVEEAEVPDLAGHPRPTLYRDIEGFELPPHPDTPKKVVTMHSTCRPTSARFTSARVCTATTPVLRTAPIGGPTSRWRRRSNSGPIPGTPSW